jgi:hypothetical protein
MRARKTLRQRIEARMARKGDTAFLTREFTDLGSERHVLRALRQLVDEGKLVRAELSPVTQQPMLAGDGFGPVARQLLDKLHVDWEPTAAERAYNEGRSTQVPMTPMVRLRSRCARKLRYKTMELAFER